MKRKGVLLLTIIIVVLIIYIVNPFEVEMPTFIKRTSDITEKVKIGDKNITVTYYSGNMIDTKVSFGNSFEKIIKLENTNDSTISYSVGFTESEISNEDLKYSLSISTDMYSGYDEIVSETNLIGDYNLKYNLGIESNKTLYIKIIFKAYNEEETTTLKGKLSINANLTKKDVFYNNVIDINNAVNTKIEEINGIRNAGYYIIDVSTLGVKDLNISGLVLVDASNIAYTYNYFYVYTDSYMVNNYKYTSKFTKANIKDRDYGTSFDWNTICNYHTNKGCSSLSNLSYNEGGSKKDFKEAADKVIELVKKDFNTKNKNVVIYDVQNDITNDTNIRGYILINNTKNVPEYYLYLTNDIFMISGYNLTKLGSISTTSGSIRAYVYESFEISALSASKVCTFSGFSNCQDKSGNIIS